jgi:hypothetical protein
MTHKTTKIGEKREIMVKITVSAEEIYFIYFGIKKIQFVCNTFIA